MQPFQVDEGARCLSAELSGLPAEVDTDAYDRFMVFEGLRQLPPVQNPHGDIADLGGGRYSVWNRRLLFSATEPSRLYTHPYWVVERTEKNQHLLQFAPRPLRSARDVATLAPPDLAAADAQHRDVRLSVGDRIVVTTHGLPPGGAERQWVYLAIGLKRAGFDVHFVMYDEPTGNNAHYMPLLEASGIPIHAVARQSPLKLLALLGGDPVTAQFCKAGIVDDVDRMARLICAYRDIGPKVVYAQLDDPNLYAGLAAVLAGVPRVVLSFRNYNPDAFPLHLQALVSAGLCDAGPSPTGLSSPATSKVRTATTSAGSAWNRAVRSASPTRSASRASRSRVPRRRTTSATA